MRWTLEEIELQAACGGVNRQQAEQLIAEVRRLRDGIRAKAEWWDANRPDAAAFKVTDDFRGLLGDDDA